MAKKKANKVKNGDLVTIHYKCTLEDGTVASDSKVTNEPLEFNVGSKMVLSGIDTNVVGMKEGEERSFTLVPAEGYGEYIDGNVSHLPKENIPAHFLNQLGPGSVIPLMSKDGTSRLVATIVEIEEETVLVDMNHPLAGQTLAFDVEVVSISEGITESTTSNAEPEGKEASTTETDDTEEGTEDAVTE